MKVKAGGKTSSVTGAILWSKAVSVKAADLGKSAHSAWYDHSFLKVPVLGAVDLSKIKSALHKKVWKPSYGKFGGGVSLGDVKDMGDGHILVELIYHIGD